MSTDHSWTESAASYALGALDDDERIAFESHLTNCPACRAEVQAYREVAGSLALTAPPASPPAGLRDRILTEAGKVRPITSAPSKLLHEQRPSRLPWVAAVAGFAAALTVGALYITEHSERMAADQERAAAQSALARAQAELQRTDSLLAALLAPDVQSAALAAQGRPPSARLYYNRARNAVVVATFDLPPARAGRTYQLWGLRGGQPTSLGTFNTPPDGRAIVTLQVPAGQSYELSAITDEPAGGSPQPTTQPFLVGRWSAP
jgi:anti-sigma-K factor RskA